MPGTYSQLLFHVVFATKRREPLISASIAPNLHAYIGGIIRAERGVALCIGGVKDHVHILLSWRTDGALSDLMRTVKSRSSKWVHDSYPEMNDFAWQEGYSAFTVSKSQEGAVKKYIEGQAEHHATVDFKTELLRLLEAHGVEYDKKYVFD